MRRGLTGRYEVTRVAGETVRAFIPHPLPPEPPLEWSAERQQLLERATVALGRLDSVSLLKLFEQGERRIQQSRRRTPTLSQVFHVLRKRPLVSVNEMRQQTGLSFPAAARAIQALEKLGIVHKITGRHRNRVFIYRDYLDILNEGTEIS
uniref:Uncharacterized protein n=1 Tax=Candidatus Caldatribacterium saccharofermentans TaxID=1454753 RepID=A0A7V4WJI8_9BACT